LWENAPYADALDEVTGMLTFTMKTPGRQRSDHLIHRLAVCDRTPCDAGTNLIKGFSRFISQALTPEVYPLHFAAEGGQKKYDRFFHQFNDTMHS